MTPKRAGLADIDHLTDSIIEKIQKLSEQAPAESITQFSDVERMIIYLGDKAKIFVGSLEGVERNSIKEFLCPNCGRRFRFPKARQERIDNQLA